MLGGVSSGFRAEGWRVQCFQGFHNLRVRVEGPLLDHGVKVLDLGPKP